MNNKEYLLNLLNYNSWANDEFFKVIIKLSSEEINKQRKSFMNSIRNSLNHLLVIDKVWLSNMKKEKHLSRLKELLKLILHKFKLYPIMTLLLSKKTQHLSYI